MPRKQKVVEKEESPLAFIFNRATFILLLIFLIIPIAFFILSASQGKTSFGLGEIVFSIVFSFLVTTFLLWIKSRMFVNPYLGAIIGLVALAALEYSLFLVYEGTYTTIFATATALIVLIYIGIIFFKALKVRRFSEEDYYEDNPGK